MKLTIFGAGCVGLVTGACLADVGQYDAVIMFSHPADLTPAAGCAPNIRVGESIRRFVAWHGELR